MLSQLRSEDGPALEIASEATLHRLSRSAASTIPGPRLPSTPSVNHSQPLPTPSSSHGGLPFACRPTPNRFPEQVDEEEDRDKDSDASGDGEAEEGSEFGGMSMGYATEDEEERKVALWTGIRGAGSDKTGTTFGMGTGNIGNSSPGSERGKMELDVSPPAAKRGSPLIFPAATVDDAELPIRAWLLRRVDSTWKAQESVLRPRSTSADAPQ